jgi:hypothetical protein
MLKWPRFGLSLSCLLALATSPAAAGAWVLWSQYLGEPHEAMAAYTDQAACEHDALWARTTEKEARGKMAAFNADKSNKLGPLPNPQQFYTCFPDTVDPRGPKGK